ncbi:MAG: hypothetical protein KDJ29_17460, partial [Hyphomicrobiales bacterium]|nr:hypothetical protein [Hyphomicrobiales bacterium]
MAVSPSASGLPAVLAALTGADSSATLNAGDVIAARVSAQLSGELARLLFRGGAIDVKLPAPLPPGSEVVFQVQQGGSAPTITILRATPAASTPQTGATPATIVTTSQPAPVAPSVPVPGGSAPQASPPSPAVAAGPVLTATSASQAAAQPSQQTQLSAQPQSTVPSGSSAPALPPSSNP